MTKRKGIRSYVSVLIMGGILMAGGMLLTQAALAHEEVTMEGMVGDAMCGAKHKMPDAAKCTAGCVGHGSKYALVVGDKVYELDGKTDGLAKLAGAKAKVKGTLEGNKITVQSVQAGS